MDTCGSPTNTANLNFYFQIAASGLTLIDCGSQTVPGASQTDDVWWSNLANTVATSNNKLLCAKSTSGSFFIRTNNPDNTKNIYVRILTDPNWYGGILQIEIRASPYSYQNSGGLCGFFDQDPTNDGFVLKQNPNSVKGDLTSQLQLADLNTIATFWRYQN